MALNKVPEQLNNKSLESPTVTTPTITGGTFADGSLGATTLTGTLSCDDEILDQPQIQDYAETVNAIDGSDGGAIAINLTLGNVATLTVQDAETTLSFTNPSATGKACSFTLILTNGASQTLNFPASVDWANNGTAPTLTASGVDILGFMTIDAGTTWYGFVGGLNFA